MHPRAAPKLAALCPPQLLDALAEGMGRVAEHVFALERSAEQQEGLESRRASVVSRSRNVALNEILMRPTVQAL